MPMYIPVMTPHAAEHTKQHWPSLEKGISVQYKTLNKHKLSITQAQCRQQSDSGRSR